MGIEFKAPTEQFKKLAIDLSNKLANEFGELMQHELGIMIKRTGQGKDVNGSPFGAYTDAYRDFKNNKGKKRKNSKFKSARGQKVDLRLSGQMLNSITVSVEKEGNQLIGIIAPSPDQVGKVKGNQETRNFFGLSDDQKRRLTRRINDLITKTI